MKRFFFFVVFFCLYHYLFSFDSWFWQTFVRGEWERKKAIPLSQTIISVFQPVSFDAEPVTHWNHFHFHQRDLSEHKCACDFLPGWSPTSFQTGEELQEKGVLGAWGGWRRGDAPLIRKTVIPAKMQSSCQNRDGWHQTLPQPKKTTVF